MKTSTTLGQKLPPDITAPGKLVRISRIAGFSGICSFLRLPELN